MQGVDPEDELLLLSLLELALLDLLLALLARGGAADGAVALRQLALLPVTCGLRSARRRPRGNGSDATGVDACDGRTG